MSAGAGWADPQPDAALLALCSAFEKARALADQGSSHIIALESSGEDSAAQAIYHKCEKTCWPEVDRLEEALTATPANTVAGLRRKAALVRLHFREKKTAEIGQTFEEQAEHIDLLAASLFNDVMRVLPAAGDEA